MGEGTLSFCFNSIERFLRQMCVEEREDTPSQTCLVEASPVAEGGNKKGGILAKRQRVK